MLGYTVVESAHRFQSAYCAAIAEGQLSNLAALPEVGVLAVLLHGDVEHGAGRRAVDVAAVGKHLLPPLLSGDPCDDPRLNSSEVSHEEAASRLRHEGCADQLR